MPAEPKHAGPEAVENEPAPAVTEAAPEVLATDRAELVDDENFVQKPAETQAAEPAETAEAAKPEPSEATKAEPLEASKVETAEVAKAEPTETKPIEPVEEPKPQPEANTEPVEPTKPAKEAEKKPPAEKKTAKQKTEEGKKVAEKADDKAQKSGNRGKNQTESRRGQADGQKQGDSRQASLGGSKNGQVGNAAVSNYPGKVRSKLARVARSVRAKGRGEVVVAFAVSSNGGVRSARVTRSSGVASVDQAALQAIRKASPVPAHTCNCRAFQLGILDPARFHALRSRAASGRLAPICLEDRGGSLGRRATLPQEGAQAENQTEPEIPAFDATK